MRHQRCHIVLSFALSACTCTCLSTCLYLSVLVELVSATVRATVFPSRAQPVSCEVLTTCLPPSLSLPDSLCSLAGVCAPCVPAASCVPRPSSLKKSTGLISWSTLLSFRASYFFARTGRTIAAACCVHSLSLARLGSAPAAPRLVSPPLRPSASARMLAAFQRAATRLASTSRRLQDRGL